jgi:hypothetical protein
MNRLAPYNRITNLFVPIVLTICIIFIFKNIYQDLNEDNYIEGLFILIGIPLILIFWLYYAFNTFDIFYDKESLILVSFRKEIRIPKDNIIRLKHALGNLSIFGMNFINYRIEFYKGAEKKDSVSFWIMIGSERLEDFINNLSEKTIVENFANTFNN